jgi:hypothetical protein
MGQALVTRAHGSSADLFRVNSERDVSGSYNGS